MAAWLVKFTNSLCIFIIFKSSSGAEISKAIKPVESIVQYQKEYKLPDLPYAYDGLEPHMDEATLRVHHLGHHAAYTKKLNLALKQWRESGEEMALASKSIIYILKKAEEIPEKWRTSIKNNGGGFVNHAIFWSIMSPNPSQDVRQPSGKIKDLITKAYGNFSVFKSYFDQQATTFFGSGYIWLCVDIDSGYPAIFGLPNQDTPLTFRLNPILVLDVWEHAYYLKHQNKRPKFVEDWWKLVDWDSVNLLIDWWEQEKVHDEL